MLIALVAVLLAIKVPAAAPRTQASNAGYKSWVMATLPDSAEGLAMDPQGRIYAIVTMTGEVVRLDEKGGYEHYATVPSKELSTAGASLGAAFDRNGNLYIAYFWLGSKYGWENDPMHLSCRDSTDRYTGVYKVDAATRTATAFATKADGWPVCLPDDVAVDSQGNVYVTDLTLSGIWKLSVDRKFTLWSAHRLLQSPPEPYGDEVAGANDLVLDRTERNLYVATDSYPAVIRIPINADGSAGSAVVVAKYLSPLDGIELDDAGTIYVTEPSDNQIVALSPDGKRRTVIATADTAPLGSPTSLVYRRGVLCATNFGSYTTGPKPRNVMCMSGFRRP
jgi:sugar lactone lactonase YvrE